MKSFNTAFFLLTIFLGLSGSAANFPVQSLDHLGKFVSGATPDVHGYPFSFAYAPAIIQVNGVWHMYFCSGGGDSPNAGWDAIRHSISADGVRWTQPHIALHISNKTKERCACDPSIVRFNAGDGDYFYLFYSGNAENVQTVNFVSRSKHPDGPFEKFTEDGTWSVNAPNPKIIISPRTATPESSPRYGAGQPSIVVKNGKLYQWYTDDTVSYPSNRMRIMMTVSSDPKSWPAAQMTNVEDAASVDVKYDAARDQFVMFAISMSHQPSTTLWTRTSRDGITWTEPQVLCNENCFPDWTHNPGVSGDSQGHLTGDSVLVAYAAPYDKNPAYNNDCGISPAPNCWIHWDIYGTVLNVKSHPSFSGILNSVSQVTGIFTAKEDGTVEGWACNTYSSQSIQLHMYMGGPAGAGGIFATSTMANLANESAVNTACKASGSHRFKIAFTPEFRRLYGGKKIYIYGISPIGGANHLLAGSGNAVIPAPPQTSVPSQKEAPMDTGGRKVENGRYYLIKNDLSQKCLDVPAGSKGNGSLLQQFSCMNSNPNQLWKALVKSDGSISFQNLYSQKCLDLPGGQVSLNGNLLQQWDCTGGANQKFITEKVGHLIYQLKSAAAPQQCLDVPMQTYSQDGSRWNTWTCANQSNQKFYFVRY